MTRLCLFTIVLTQALPTEAIQALRGPRDLRPTPTNTWKFSPGGVEEDAASVQASLLDEFSNHFSSGAVTDRVSRLQEVLRPMFTSVPKEADGTLGHTLVRYMLHRHVVQQYGWFIRGLEPNTGSDKAALEQGGNKTFQGLQEWVPTFLQDFLEKLQGGRGINLRELAVLAATFEDLIHKEAVHRLGMTFHSLELPNTTLLDQPKLREALEVYLMIYMLGGNFTLHGAAPVLKAHEIFASKMRNWGAMQDWMHGIQLEVSPASVDHSLNFTSATLVIEEVGKRYGKYNNDGECQTLKSEMLAIETTKAGRVRLSDFYEKGLSGVFDFNEKREYLASLGALDESNPDDPLVIVANYVSSRPNCLVASGFYVVCCSNECENFLSTLERKFEAPTATPEAILEQVATMIPGTAEAPRTLSDVLVKRLNSIAKANEGEVPLHGRLFALWMHHVFPRECPFPHKGGSSPQTPDEWMQSTGQEAHCLDPNEIQAFVDSEGRAIGVKGPEAQQFHMLEENDLPWDEAEEVPATVAPLQLHREESTTTEAVLVLKAVPSTPQRSLFHTESPMATLGLFIVGFAIFAWKMMASLKPKKTSTFQGSMANCALV